MKKLTAIQTKLKAPKNHGGNGKVAYKYRSCEDILESLKPLLAEQDCSLVINDDIVQIGERYYVKATARLIDNEDGKIIEASAFARESETAKFMAESQLTGATSSYARKYALNGLFAIDDTKDADAMDNTKTPPKKETPKTTPDASQAAEKAVNDAKTVKELEVVKARIEASQNIKDGDKFKLFKKIKDKTETFEIVEDVDKIITTEEAVDLLSKK